MRYLILSDLHGNREALDAVLADARGAWDEALCLGDLVGYCADPNAVTDWVRANTRAVVRGNHDKACAGLEDLEWFNPVARSAATWTMNTLTPENLDYLRALPKGPLAIDSFRILHGSPLDEDEYLFSPSEAAQIAPYLDTQVSFFGHTHLQGGFQLNRRGARRIGKPDSTEHTLGLELEEDWLYLLNPGAAGQPRDGDSRAAYALYDAEARAVEYRRIPYDIRKCQEKIVAAGLPEMLAFRLEVGT